MSRFVSDALGKRDRKGFSSGNDRIDGYFRDIVSQDVKRRYAACYVLVETATDGIAGFYTLSSTNIPLTDIPADLARKLPRYPTVPAILIGWLGRDEKFRGENLGAMLLYDAIARAAGSSAGAHAICADAIDDAAAAFYERHGFAPLESRPRSFFLPVATGLGFLKDG